MTELVYPFDTTPELGTTMTVAEGVRWLRMPLPLALDHINLYMIEDDDGWWIVDTGMKWGDVQSYWQQIFDNELHGKPIKGVFVTHMHPDHIGQAGWICKKFRIPLHITFGEYFMARSLSTMTKADLDWTTQAYFRSVGFDDNYLEKMKEKFHGFGSVVEALPGAFHRIEEGSEFIIAGRKWTVVIGRGHSPEHACFFCEELDVLISGDQIIPRITSNVSVMPSEPEANPLVDWFASLQKFKQFPATTLVLPAHNTPFYGLHSRLEFLIAHHQDHLLALEEACVSAKNATELLPVLFKRELDAAQMSMAIGECVAHLNYLHKEGKLQREMDSDGVYYYLSIAPDLAERARPGSHQQDDEPIQV